jgi:hypothetical protein
MKAKTLLWIGVAIIFAAVIAGAVWWELRKQIITFDDGSELTLLAVDYGKTHKSPEINMAGGPLRAHTFNTSNDTLVVWVYEKLPDRSWRNFQFYAYDPAGTACAADTGMTFGSNRKGNQIVSVQFNAFPRRQGRIYVRVQENGNGGQEMSDDKFVISNPARGPFTALAGVPLPDTQEDGNFSVTLKKLVARSKMPFMRNNDADASDPINQGVQATFHMEIDGTNAENWQPVAVETSDGTGNKATGWLNMQSQEDDCIANYQYGLWSDEPAWKLRVEFSKQSGFNDDELWTIPGIPLQNARYRDFYNYGRRQKQAGTPFAAADLGDYHISVLPIKQFTDMANSNPQGGLTIEVDPAPPQGMRLTLVKLTDDAGDDIQHWDYGQQGQASGKGMVYRYGLQDLQGGTNFTLSVALHKSHFLEFTAKPEIAPADASDQSNQ